MCDVECETRFGRPGFGCARSRRKSLKVYDFGRNNSIDQLTSIPDTVEYNSENTGSLSHGPIRVDPDNKPVDTPARFNFVDPGFANRAIARIISAAFSEQCRLPIPNDSPATPT